MKYLIYWKILIITAFPFWIDTKIEDRYGKVQIIPELHYRHDTTYESHDTAFLTRDSAFTFYNAANEQAWKDSCDGGTVCTYKNNRQFVDSIKIDSIP